MTRKDLTIYTAAILTTLDEEPSGGCPESHLYIALGMDLQKWHAVRDFLQSFDWITIRVNWVEITAEGRDIAAKVTAAQSAPA
jgi:hypothetical protein